MQTIKIIHHGRQIDGSVYRPEGEGQFPIVIFSHGFNGSRSDFGHITEPLLKNGIGSVCYNFCGGSPSDKSGFPTTRMSLVTEKEDLFAVLDEARSWKWVDTDRIYLFGSSQGGMVSALTAEERGEQIKAMILQYPAFCIADDWNKRFPRIEDIPEQVELWGVALGRAYFEAVHDFEISERTGKYDKPVLFMHGTEDAVVPIAYSEQAVKRYPKARLEVFPGEGHGFSQAGDKLAAEKTLKFIQSTLLDQSSLTEIIKEQTKRALWEVKNVIDCVPDELWNKEYCKMPCWKHIYHMLHSLDLWYINPRDRNYKEPDLHEEDLNNLDVVSDKILSRAEINGYLTSVETKILDYTSGLSDNQLLQYPENCEYCVFTLIMAQFRHLHSHMGMLMGFIIEDAGLWPRVLGLEKPFPKGGYDKYF